MSLMFSSQKTAALGESTMGYGDFLYQIAAMAQVPAMRPARLMLAR